MPARRGGLGRGLDALIGGPPEGADPGSGGRAATAEGGSTESGSSERTSTESGSIEVELERIQPNPRQPRRQIDDVALAELADSVREHGLIQPLVVSRLEPSAGSQPRYQLITGERRWHAARLAGLARVPVVLREASPRDLLELALVENVQRADLNPIEAALAYQALAQEFQMTQEQIGQRVGKSRFAVANTLRLLQLPASVQQAVVDDQLSEGHARALLGLADRETQRRVAEQVLAQGLSVRQTEELVRRSLQPAEARRGRPPRDVLEIEERLRAALGTRVSLTRSKRGGRLTIFYSDDEHLQSLYDRLAGKDGAT